MFTCHDILGDDLHISVTIRPSMLMPEAHNMAELMNHNSQLVTVLADTDRLWTVSSLPHKRATTGRKKSF